MEKASFCMRMEKYLKATFSLVTKKDLGMKSTQTTPSISETSFKVKEKEEESFNGKMEKSMMVSGRATKNLEAVFGKVPTIFPM